MSCFGVFFFFKQKTAYDMRISDWSSDVCSSDLLGPLLEKLGNGSKGINWSMGEAVELLRSLNRTVLDEGISKGQPRIQTDIDAIETILRSEERRVGKECVSTCRSRWSPYN